MHKSPFWWTLAIVLALGFYALSFWMLTDDINVTWGDFGDITPDAPQPPARISTLLYWSHEPTLNKIAYVVYWPIHASLTRVRIAEGLWDVQAAGFDHTPPGGNERMISGIYTALLLVGYAAVSVIVLSWRRRRV